MFKILLNTQNINASGIYLPDIVHLISKKDNGEGRFHNPCGFVTDLGADKRPALPNTKENHSKHDRKL